MNGESLNADRSAAPPKPEEIERSTYEYGAEPYRDPHVLRVLYHDWELSQREIGEQCGVSQQSIQRWFERFGIDTRPPMNERNRSISKSQVTKDKVQYHVPDTGGEYSRFYRHELVALLSENSDGDWAFSPSDVFGDGSHVHHEAAAPTAIDVPGNLSILSVREHMQLHGGPQISSRVETTLDEIFAEYDGEPDPDEFELTDEEIHRLEEASRTISGD